MNEKWLGLDIGGANIKYSDAEQNGGGLPFAMWLHPDQLVEVLQTRIPDWADHKKYAVTMTGELADCFQDKKQGVGFICDAVLSAAAETADVLFYQTTGEFVDIEDAKKDWLLTAASNWHALASAVGLRFPDCILIDIGSTTTDVIPIRCGRPVAIGKTDQQRLKHSELIYTGVVRSPVVAVLPTVNFDGGTLNLAQEVFATMLDVYLVLGQIDPGADCRRTADGRAANKAEAFRRLARMVCCDLNEISANALLSIARQVADQQANLIRNAISCVSQRCPSTVPYVVCGEGAWLGQQILRLMVDQHRIHCGSRLSGSDDSNADRWSTASAVACLARRNIGVMP